MLTNLESNFFFNSQYTHTYNLFSIVFHFLIGNGILQKCICVFSVLQLNSNRCEHLLCFADLFFLIFQENAEKLGLVSLFTAMVHSKHWFTCNVSELTFCFFYYFFFFYLKKTSRNMLLALVI